MIPAAILGFSVGAAIAWWTVLRSLSHGAAELEADPVRAFMAYAARAQRSVVYLPPDDPLDTVQTADPYVFALTLDCE